MRKLFLVLVAFLVGCHPFDRTLKVKCVDIARQPVTYVTSVDTTFQTLGDTTVPVYTEIRHPADGEILVTFEDASRTQYRLAIDSSEVGKYKVGKYYWEDLTDSKPHTE